ncbi:MAG: transposase, partial [Gammaproteobacteria bacterium]
WDGCPLPAELKGELEREYTRLKMVEEQLRLLEKTRTERLKQADVKSLQGVAQLMLLRAMGPSSAWVLVMEFFGWRRFRNRRELASSAGLTGTPYASGESRRDQGIEPSRESTGPYDGDRARLVVAALSA